MSALDDLIRRLMAQRACLDRAAEWVRQMPGPLLLIGFGDGNAYHHLRALLPGREIVIFDRSIDAEVLLDLPSQDVILGDPLATLPLAWERLSRSAVLVHLNFPVTNPPRVATELAPLIAPIVAPGAIIVSEKPVPVPGWTELQLPEAIREGRHYLYQAA